MKSESLLIPFLLIFLSACPAFSDGSSTSNLLCSDQVTGGSTNQSGSLTSVANDDHDIRNFLMTAGSEAGVLVEGTNRGPGHPMNLFQYGTLVMLRENPPLYGIRENVGHRTFTHQFDLQGVASLNGRIRLFLNRDNLANQITQGIRRTPFTYSATLFAFKSMERPQSTNHHRLGELSDSLLKRETVFSMDILSEFFNHQPEVIRQLARRWYEEASLSILEKAAELRPHHLVLILDPGIASRMDRFLVFYRDFIRQAPDSLAVDIRMAFSEDLKFTRVWRGFMMPNNVRLDQRDRVAQHLRLPGVLKNIQGYARNTGEIIRRFFDETQEGRSGSGGPKGVFDAISSQETDPLTTPFISTSKYIEVAQMAAWDHMANRPQGGRFYLAELRMPTIDLIEKSENFGGFSSWYKRSHYRTSSANGQPFERPMTDPGFEILATQIKAENVMNIYPYETLPPGFSIVER